MPLSKHLGAILAAALTLMGSAVQAGTLDDIRKQQFEIRDPLKDLPSQGPVVVLQ